MYFHVYQSYIIEILLLWNYNYEMVLLVSANYLLNQLTIRSSIYPDKIVLCQVSKEFVMCTFIKILKSRLDKKNCVSIGVNS